jgi:hypothetical protein
VLLKLLFAGAVKSRVVHAGYVLKWHKREGERIEFGDDICDLLVVKNRVPIGFVEVHLQREGLVEPEKMAEVAMKLLRGEAVPMAEIDAETLGPPVGPTFTMRMAASDTGVLRRICAREEQPVEAGQVLAVLTTDRDEGVGDMDETLRNAAAFRVVNNRVDAMHEEMSQ